jgi:hypothetical protein
MIVCHIAEEGFLALRKRPHRGRYAKKRRTFYTTLKTATQVILWEQRFYLESESFYLF